MTVTVQNPEQQHTGNGVLTTFAFSFRVDDNSDLQVFLNNILQAEGADYDVDSISEAGGSVTFALPPPAGSVVTLRRVTNQIQDTDYTAYDAFPAETHERALDKLTMIVQELTAFGGFFRDKLGLAWDALNLRITNLGDPQLPEDAVNQRTMENYVLNNAPPGPEGPEGPQGDQGFTGPTGFMGPPGTTTTWHSVTSVPSPTLGVNGDWAINTVNGDIFYKANDAWTLEGNLQGPTIPVGGNDHATLVNLLQDNHPQYHNDTRGDARYLRKAPTSLETFTGPEFEYHPSSGPDGLKFWRNAANTYSGLRPRTADGSDWDFSSDFYYQRSAQQWGFEKPVRFSDGRVFETHTHAESDITGLVGKYALATHTHTTAEVAEVPVRSQGVSTTIQLADAGSKIELTSSGVVSVPTNASVPFSGPVAVLVRQAGTGAVTISPNSGVTIRSFPGTLGARTLAGEGASAVLHYRPDIGVNTWDLDGRFI